MKLLRITRYERTEAIYSVTTLVPRVEVMIEEDVRDRCNHLELRLERFDATLSQIEQGLSDGFAQMSTRLEGMGNRLVDKAALGGRPVESNAASVHRRGPCSSEALPIAM
jgi:hypothetical protein